jgi:hypothetical protein
MVVLHEEGGVINLLRLVVEFDEMLFDDCEVVDGFIDSEERLSQGLRARSGAHCGEILLHLGISQPLLDP